MNQNRVQISPPPQLKILIHKAIHRFKLKNVPKNAPKYTADSINMFTANGDHTKEWYAEYYFYSESGFKTRHRIKAGINYITNKQDKLIYAQALQEQILELLNTGINPAQKDKKEKPKKYTITTASEEIISKYTRRSRRINLQQRNFKL